MFSQNIDEGYDRFMHNAHNLLWKMNKLPTNGFYHNFFRFSVP